MKKTLNVLITGAGAPGIRGTLYSLKSNPDGVSVRTVGVDSRDEVVGRYLVDRFHTVPKGSDPAYLDRLLEICRKEKVELILPQTEYELWPLSRAREELRTQGIGVMVSSEQAIVRSNDKTELLKTFERLELPFPKYRRATSEAELIQAVSDLGYPAKPVVVKPPVASGMRGIRILKEEAWDVRRFLEEKPSGVEIGLEALLPILRRGRFPELLVTEYLPGPEYTVDVFSGRKGSLAIPRLRKEIRSGISFVNRIELRKDLIDFSLKAGREIGLELVYGFQFKLDEGGTPRILECNPRIQGTMAASTFSGANLIWMAVRELRGEAVEIPSLDRLVEAEFLRFWGGVGIARGQVQEI